ncbi:aldehyde dehydrogenase family protein [Ligilactobacillus faecis]|uniref:aldehyde dehydrogenase family protein n=1 Tax=Ligilactobacillus faecis TaxID=762833 RepID=UPI0024694F9D|nr:aldehyde dehydrogenase family protein [Ligilactobacillus faecis]WGN89757.1 aldehyde dehydrogenase family protein [Ligilactobacillus faecis]
MAYVSKNPYSNEVMAEFETLTDVEFEAKIAKAEEAFKTWKETSFATRAQILKKAAKLFRERNQELAALNTKETGKLITISLWENQMCADIFEYNAEHAAEFLAPHYLKTEDQLAGDAIGIYQPLGTIYEIEPWNVPFFQMARPTAAQLMAGNTVVLKHSSNVPQCALAFEKLLLDAGLPEGVFQNLFVDYEQSDRLLSDPRISGVTITGSTEVGREVAAKATHALKKNVMELGGSDAMVVLPDADMATVIEGALLGRLTNSGQVCLADKRMLIHESLYQTFLDELTKATNELTIGDPLEETTSYGPLCSKKAAAKVKAQIQKAVSHGAKATPIGPEVPADSAWVQATLLTEVTQDNPIAKEEIFGPVFMVFSYKDEAEMLALANGTPFGLGASVYTTDPKKAAALGEKLEAGAISINQPTMASYAIPFGGIKDSGYGREMSFSGMREFTNEKYLNSAKIDMQAVFENISRK